MRGLKPYTAARCTLIHFEEQHVQHDVARLAVRHGMWSVVKPMISGFHGVSTSSRDEVYRTRFRWL